MPVKAREGSTSRVLEHTKARNRTHWDCYINFATGTGSRLIMEEIEEQRMWVRMPVEVRDNHSNIPHITCPAKSTQTHPWNGSPVTFSLTINLKNRSASHHVFHGSGWNSSNEMMVINGEVSYPRHECRKLTPQEDGSLRITQFEICQCNPAIKKKKTLLCKGDLDSCIAICA